MTKELLTTSIDNLYSTLGVDGTQPISILPVELLSGKHHPLQNPSHPLLITGVTGKEQLSDVFTILSQVYPDNQPVKMFCDDLGSDIHVLELHLIDLKNEMPSNRTSRLNLLVMPLTKDNAFEEFQEIIAHLRAPNGCPWDREQTHLSLRNNLLEETYETLETIDRQDIAGMQEEFGDLLLQIVLHAQIAAEAGEFRMEDIISGIYRKIVRRHPHVFSDVEVTGVGNVLQNWEKLKQQERVDKGVPEKGLLDGVPVVLPSLTQAQELQDRAARVGFDWPSIEPVWDKVMEELDEVKRADSPEEVEKELGDLLFAVVNLIRWYKVDSESALRGTNQKFRRRFKHIEKSARKIGRDLPSMSLDEMDEYWNEAKGFE
jgi:tetrapyrrole methylase family protein/MazG family protein